MTVNVSKTGAFGSNESSTVNVNKGATLNVSGTDTSLKSLTMNIADSLLTLADNVTAASAMLNLTGTAKAVLTNNASAGNATVNVSKDSTLALEENASGGNATVNNSGLMTFADYAMAENTVVKNLAGGKVDISAVDSATSIGSLSGAGNVELGNKELSLGNLHLDDTISGIISGNDGSLVNRMMRSTNHHEKEYLVRVNKPVTDAFLQKMASGVRIRKVEKGEVLLDAVTRPCEVEKLGKCSFRIVLTQGLNRQIRRMCETLGYHVEHLKRIRVLNIELKGMKPGTWRKINDREMAELQELLKDSKN